MTINFNSDPYYDDYDESKGFHRILFRPGLSVQNRELIQLQTILQKQIERHGSHVFKEGAKVFGAEFSYTPELDAVKIDELLGSTFVSDYVEELVGKTIVGANTGVTATVLAYTPITADDPLTLYLSYTSTGLDRETSKFENGESLVCQDAVGLLPANSVVAKVQQLDATAVGIGASITRGVYYVKGFFVLADPQFYVVSKYTNEVDAQIGLEIEESIVTASEDESLLDNANGTPNFTGRGADRYTIKLNLTSVDIDAEPLDFIEIERIRNGAILSKTRTTPYNELSKTLARRTADINGSFVSEPFKLKIKEALNDFRNEGVYEKGATSNDGNVINDDSYAVTQISEGKAYVDGYEVESIGAKLLDIEKPRDSKTVNNASVPMEIGNFIRVNNTYNMPDIYGDGISTPLNTVKFYDTVTATSGAPAGEFLGVARIKSYEYDSATSDYVMNLFDIKMTQKILPSSSFSALPDAGALVKGQDSGATGYVNSESTSGALYLTSVSGDFKVGETLLSVDDNDTALGSPVQSVVKNSFEAVRQVYSDTSDSINFTADVTLTALKPLVGVVEFNSASVTVNGTFTNFTESLKVGDILYAGLGEEKGDLVVASITDDTTLDLESAPPFSTDNTEISKYSGNIFAQDNNISIRELGKPYIRTLKPGNVSQSDITYKKQFIKTVSGGTITLTESGTGNFLPEDSENYSITALNGTVVGQTINGDDPTLSFSGAGTSTLSIDIADGNWEGVSVKVIATITKLQAASKVKTAKIAEQTEVFNYNGQTNISYGTSAHHDEVSLGVTDVYRLLGVYDSNNASTDAAVPELVLSNIVGTFTNRETITGETSGASAIILTNTSPLQYVLLSSIDFVEGENITGSSASAVIASITAGSKNITDRYLLDTGQRDNYYDIAKIVIKQRAPKPQGRLLVVYDRFEHGSGLYFDVNSYDGIDYKDIPYYSATRIDPTATNSSGIFDLRSVIDYRPTVGNIGTVNNGVRRLDPTDNSFDFESRNFVDAGSSTTASPKNDTLFNYSYEHYLGRSDTIWLTSNGEWLVIQGEPSENPILPEEISNAMKVADLHMPPYVLDAEDIEVESKLQKRFRMEDIDRLSQRVDNIEYYTSLSLLESSVESLQVKDSNGLDRFKSGFLVDNFGGHKTGDTANQDYRCAIDMENQILRPKYDTKNVTLKEKVVGSPGYKINDNIVTLDYTHVATIKQRFATRVESLTPSLNSSWVGDVKLTPSSDSWFETKRAPDVTKNVEGNYNALLAANRNSLGTIWGASRTSWTGVVSERAVQTQEGRSRSGFLGGLLNLANNRNETSRRFVVTSESRITREGVRTSLVERVDTRLEGDRVIANDLIPYMRSRQIKFEGTGFKPYTRVYPFFDNVNVARFITQNGGSVAGTPQTITGVTTAGAWNTISKIQLTSLWSRSNDAQSTGFKIETSPDKIAWTEVEAGTFFNQTTSDDVVVAENLAVESNPVNGELYVRITFTKPDDMQFDAFKIFDQAGNQIDEKYLELDRNLGFNNISRVFDEGNSIRPRTFASFGFTLATFIVKVIDGPKTTVPENGTIRTIDNSTVSNEALITDGTGRVSGIFTIPDPTVLGNPKFRTGERILRLTSSPDDSNTGVTTAGEGTYSARGVMQTRQRTFIATRNGEIKRETVSQSFTRRVSRTEERNTRRWRDPLAQSFQVTTAGGEFLTKVDVFFESKDNFIPVRCELREMENGAPTSRIIPNSSVVIEGEDVKTSNDGTVPTTFEFSAPIYVKEGTELALVLLSDSEDYRVFISKLGESNLTDNAIVSTQPYLGVLFKSQNSSTWVPYENEDLKFTMYRAKFNVGGATLTLENEKTEYEALESDPIEITNGSNLIKVYHQDHHMFDSTNAVEIRDVTTGVNSTLNSDLDIGNTIFTFPNVPGMPTTGTALFKVYRDVTNTNEEPDYPDVTTKAEVIRGTVSVVGQNITVTISTRGINNPPADIPAGSRVELYQFGGIELIEVNKKHTAIQSYSMDSYVIAVGDTATEDARFGGDAGKATGNALVNAYQLMVPTVVHNNTTINTTLNLLTGASYSGTETPFNASIAEVTNTADIISLRNAGLIASQPNEDENNSGNKSCTVDMQLSTSVDNLSPVVDLERANIATFANRLENIQDAGDTDVYTPPTAPQGDSGESIYMTKRVQLENPATALKVFLDAAVLSESGIEVMYKTLRSDDSVDFDEIGWTYFNTDGSPDDVVGASSNENDYKEYGYTQEELPEFIGFAIKIRMVGTNSCTPPFIKNLRAIALAV